MQLLFNLSFIQNHNLCFNQYLSWRRYNLFPEVQLLRRRQSMSVAQLPCFGVWDKNRKSWQEVQLLFSLFYVSICLFRVSLLSVFSSLLLIEGPSIPGSIFGVCFTIWSDIISVWGSRLKQKLLFFILIADENRLEASGSQSCNWGTNSVISKLYQTS